ncbi:MAG TPA: acetate uptake transporter [Ktedonobacteraceae bacterium]|jgi:succinate-acetate transporter protein|nr:acetate uptake transporter [Ktedonobacteraceae bacterium]
MALYAAEEGAQAVAPSIANPAPLGLSAFALTTFVLSCSNAGFIFPAVASGGTVVVGLAFFYGGLMQLVAGIQEFRAGNTFGATAFCSYGGFWMALGFILLPITGILTSLVAAKALSQGVGVFLLGWTIFTALMFIGTLKLNLALIVVFGLLTLTFLALTIGWLAGVGTGTFTTWVGIGGWLGILTAIAAWYTALAGVLSSVKLVNLPTMPRD